MERLVVAGVMKERHYAGKTVSKLLMGSILGLAVVLIVEKMYWVRELLVLLLGFAIAFSFLALGACLGCLFLAGAQILLRWFRAGIDSRASTAHALRGKPLRADPGLNPPPHSPWKWNR